MRILSIDWDYFFPSSDYYDWGANEEMPIFFESIWPLRCNSKNLKTKVSMLDEYVPTIPRNFWKIVQDKPILYIAESHKLLYDFLKFYKSSIVYNLDAHHDCGYGYDKEVNCGNWGKFALDKKLIKEFFQIYPEWRKQKPEGNLDQVSSQIHISYELPEPMQYDTIFVCRSGCWTPPWFDQLFFNFINTFNNADVIHHLDKLSKYKRAMTIEEARSYKEQQEQIIQELMKRSKND